MLNPELDLECLQEEIESLKSELELCRNELCLRCGQYRRRHLGAYDGCRWLEPPKEET